MPIISASLELRLLANRLPSLALQDAVGPAAIRPAITPGAVGGAGLWHAEAALSRPLGSGALPGQQVTPFPWVRVLGLTPTLTLTLT